LTIDPNQNLTTFLDPPITALGQVCLRNTKNLRQIRATISAYCEGLSTHDLTDDGVLSEKRHVNSSVPISVKVVIRRYN